MSVKYGKVLGQTAFHSLNKITGSDNVIMYGNLDTLGAAILKNIWILFSFNPFKASPGTPLTQSLQQGRKFIAATK